MNPAAQQLPLEDIILPPQPGIWPLAPGWWALIILSIILIAAVIFYIRYRKQKKIQRIPFMQAQQNINALTVEYQQLSPEFIQALNTQLKLWCRHRYPAAVNLYGKDWAVFLSQTADIFSKDELRLLGAGGYVPPGRFDGAAQPLLQSAQKWLDTSEWQWRPQHA